MKYFRVLILGFVLSACNNVDKAPTSENKSGEPKPTEVNQSKDKEEIQKLIRQVLNWSNLERNIELLPAIPDKNDSLYISLDLDKHKANLEKLKSTNFFAKEFIENYNQIILNLNKKLSQKEEVWPVGDIAPFNFASDVNPWCLCQDVPFDNPNPWDFIEVEAINLTNDKGDLKWKWGKLELNENPDWKKFAYKFRVSKENGTWKISYLEGFDFNESTK